MKSNHILWSLIVLAIIVFLPNLLYHPSSKLGGGPEIFALYLLLWIVLSITSPFLLLLEAIGVIPGNRRFLLTFLIFINLYFGVQGLYLVFRKEFAYPSLITASLFVLNLIWSLLLFITIRSKNRIDQSQHI